MKRHLALVLLAALLLSLSGCGPARSGGNVGFYYCRNQDNFLFGSEDAVIAPEYRSISTSAYGLDELLAIYFQGPQDPLLRSPFPEEIKLVETKLEEDTLHIILDASFTQLENLDLTLACACLAQTCMDLTPARQVSIFAEDTDKGREVSMTLHQDQLLFQDTTELPVEPTTDSN